MESHDSVQSQINLTHIVTSFFLKIPFLSSSLTKNLPVKDGEDKSYNGSAVLRHAQIVLLHSQVGTPE
jgi:hypothetical protein